MHRLKPPKRGRHDLACGVNPLATPDHWHAVQTIMACDAGKDVYVEKPLSLTVREGRRMVEAARRNNRVVQVGTQRRSSKLYAQLAEPGAVGRDRQGDRGPRRADRQHVTQRASARCPTRRRPKGWTGTCGSAPAPSGHST